MDVGANAHLPETHVTHLLWKSTQSALDIDEFGALQNDVKWQTWTVSAFVSVSETPHP